jgi:hypothetical protein
MSLERSKGKRQEREKEKIVLATERKRERRPSCVAERDTLTFIYLRDAKIRQLSQQRAILRTLPRTVRAINIPSGLSNLGIVTYISLEVIKLPI